MKIFSRNLKIAMLLLLLAASLILSISLIGVGGVATADEVKGAPYGSITSVGPGAIDQYSSDHFTGLVIDGQEAQLSQTALRLPTDSAKTLKSACDYAGYKSDPKSGGKSSGDICDDQEKTSKIFEAVAKATGIPGAYLMCAMESGPAVKDKEADNAVNEMQKNKDKFKAAWQSFQDKLKSDRSDGAVTKNALTSDKTEDLEVRIFGMGMVFRDALQPSSDPNVKGPDLSNLKGQASNIDILNYLIIAHDQGMKAAVDYVNSGFKNGSGHTSAEKCISKVNGIPLPDDKKSDLTS